MKRKCAMFGIILSILCAVSTAQAALVWQTTPDPQAFQYSLAKNGGFLWNGGFNMGTDFLPSASKVDTKSSAGGDPFSSTASATLSEFSGGVVMTGWSAGPASGSNPTDGLQVRGYTSFSINNSTYSVDTNQELNSFVARRFTVTHAGTYDLTASLIGTANFTTIGNAATNFHALATIGGTVNIDEFTVVGGELQGLGTIATLNLSDMNANGLKSVEFRTVTPENNPVIYQITAVLNLKTDIQNVDMITYEHTGNLNGTWNLGSLANPFSLQASLSESAAAPLPASLLFFLSGLGGLGLMRRRMKS